MTMLRFVQVFFMYFKQNELLTVCLKHHQMAPRKPRRQNINLLKKNKNLYKKVCIQIVDKK